MKFNSVFYVLKQRSITSALVLIIMMFSTVSTSDGGLTWCWTRSMATEPSFILNPASGGLNWGYCQKDQKPAPIKYIVTVTTSQIEKSETASVVRIQVFGEKGKTQEKILSSSGFERGNEKLVEFEADDVGKIEKIALRVTGNLGYRCKNILIQKGVLSRNFECSRRIEPCPPGRDPKECVLELEGDGDTPFEITTKTSEERDAGTKSPLFIGLKGNKGESRLKILNELGLAKGSTETTIINIKDVGELSGLKLYIGAHGKWKPSLISVKNLITGIIKIFDLNGPVLISPGSDTYSMDQSDKPNSKDADAENNNNLDGSGNDSSPEPTADEKDAINIHNPNGGLIEQSERKNIIDLTCEQKLINPSPDKILFGPNYPTRSVNYLRILARCPNDCHKITGVVYGVGIHPETSPICLSALVDRSLSFYGGIISISIFPGQDSYNIPSLFPKKIDQISLQNLTSKSIMKSYVTSKVDNINLIKKDLRIINHKGELASEGRLEMRVQGKWGSVCSIGNTALAARVICKNIGYRDGEWKSPTDETGRDFCRNYKGFDYCGAQAARIHFEKIECTDRDSHINTCNKELANLKVCTHGFDVIISCYNEVYETEMPVPVGVIRLAALSVDRENFIGRLEMFNKQKFRPICELGFNDDSANIACKQMGYIKGTYVTENIAKNFKLPSNSNEKFAAGNIECRGNEKSFKECKSKLEDISCKHDQDVVIRCEGDQGDPTGKKQYMPKPITPAPELGKLGLSKSIIECTHKGNNPMFRGDPGSVFLVECPVNCTKEPGTMAGTGVYTSDSNICLAAIHAGVIENEKGGMFAYIKTFGQSQWSQTSRNGIMSSQLNLPWISGFSVSQLNTGWLGMHKAFTESASIKTKGMNTSSFLELGSSFQSSFLQIDNDKLSESSLPKPIFKFLEPTPNYNFNDKSAIALSTHTLSRVSTYSILTRFKMEKFKNKKEFIFSYSGCSGFNILIDRQDTLILGDMCNPNARINTKIMMPLNEMITLFIMYEKGTINVYFESEKMGIVRREIKSRLEINPAREIGIGRLGQAPKGIFYGLINFVVIYDTILSESAIPTIIDSLKNENNGAKLTKTADGRGCLSPCIDSKPGEGTPPPEAKLDCGNETNNVPLPKGSSPPPKKGDIGTYDPSERNNQETMQLDCETNATDKRFAGEAGKFFRVHCPVCTTSKAIVYGTGVYHPLSSICKAAMHIGKLAAGVQGDFIVELTSKKDTFNGSVGVDKSLSGSFGKAESSFIIRKAEKHLSIPCERTAGQDVFLSATQGTKFVVVCPANCTKSQLASAYGSEVYSDNSSICYAAIHYGILSDKGGEVEFIIEGEQSSFKSTKGFGVISKAKESYIRSFRFLGQKSTLAFKFAEDYKGKVYDKWAQHTDLSAEDREKDSWEYIKENRPSRGVFETFLAVHHTGITRMSSEYGFASWITLKDSEFANGVIKFNIKAVDMSPFGIVFRYQDSENFYAIQFSLKDHRANVRLISKINSSLKIIESKHLTMLQPEYWFRCTLILNFEEMKFLIQQENAREHKIIFSKPITELQRGTLGLASNGNSNVYFSGVRIEDYKPNLIGKTLGNVSKIRTFEELLKKTKKVHIKTFCGEVYKNPSRDFDRCKQPHSFCLIKCDSLVPFAQEGIVNFRCFKDCVKSVYNSNLGTLEMTVSGSSINRWEPREGERIDYLFKGSTSYRPAKIISVVNRMKKKQLKIEYTDDDGEVKKSSILYPDDKSIAKCGEKLTQRLDCNDRDYKESMKTVTTSSAGSTKTVVTKTVVTTKKVTKSS